MFWTSGGNDGTRIVFKDVHNTSPEVETQSTRFVRYRDSLKVRIDGSTSTTLMNQVIYDETLTIDSASTWPDMDLYPNMYGSSVVLTDNHPTVTPTYGVPGDVIVTGSTIYMKHGDIGSDTDWSQLTDNSLWSTGGTGSDIYYDSGKVGVGESTPTATLHVVGEGATSTTDGLTVEDSGFNTLFHVRDDGRVGIGTDAPTRNLEILTDVNSGNGIIVNSDSNLSDTYSSISLNVDVAGTTRGGSMFYGSDAYAGNGVSFTDPDGYLANTLTITTGGGNRGSINVGTRDSGKPIRLFSGQSTGTGALDDGNLGMIISGTTSGNPIRIIMPNLPTAAAGLPSGALWNNGGVINIV